MSSDRNYPNTGSGVKAWMKKKHSRCKPIHTHIYIYIYIYTIHGHSHTIKKKNEKQKIEEHENLLAGALNMQKDGRGKTAGGHSALAWSRYVLHAIKMDSVPPDVVVPA
jgi:hypothetical protein